MPPLLSKVSHIVVLVRGRPSDRRLVTMKTRADWRKSATNR